MYKQNKLFKDFFVGVELDSLVVKYQTTGSGLEKEQSLSTIIKRLEHEIWSISSSYQNLTQISVEDKFSECLSVIERAIMTFNQTNGKFKPYCSRVMRQEMDKLYRKYSTMKRKGEGFTRSLDQVLDESGDILLHQVSDIDSFAVNVEIPYELHNMLTSLPLSEKERTVCVLLSYGETKSEIADRMNISNAMVSKYVKSIRKKMEENKVNQG